MDLSGKKIVVSGVASGIGKASTRVLKERGAMVLGLDRREPAHGLVDAYIPVNFLDIESIDRAVESIDGGIDGLCNIAGVPPTAPVTTVVTVNFVALRYFTEQMLNKLADGASIVNMASLAGAGWRESIEEVKRFMAEARFDNVDVLCRDLGVDEQRSYFFTKELLRVWTMQNWDTWRQRGIRVNAISPGPVETPILADFLDTLGDRADEDMSVMGRAATAEEIAPVVAFLCSDDSVWINGANIAADGGMNAHMMKSVHGF